MQMPGARNNRKLQQPKMCKYANQVGNYANEQGSELKKVKGDQLRGFLRPKMSEYANELSICTTEKLQIDFRIVNYANEPVEGKR